MVREMEALIQLKKYRHLRKAYGDEQTTPPSSADLAEIERMVTAAEKAAAKEK